MMVYSVQLSIAIDDLIDARERLVDMMSDHVANSSLFRAVESIDCGRGWIDDVIEEMDIRER